MKKRKTNGEIKNGGFAGRKFLRAFIVECSKFKLCYFREGIV